MSFEIDANGILKVSARDKGTGREQSVEITNSGGLSQNEVDRMRKEAELYTDEDSQRKELVELKNSAESLFYSYESTLRDNGELINEDLKLDAAAKIAALKAAISDSEIPLESFKSYLEATQQVLYAFGSAVYQNSGTSTGTSSGTFSGSTLSGRSPNSALSTPPAPSASPAPPAAPKSGVVASTPRQAAPDVSDPFAIALDDLAHGSQDETVRVDTNPFANPFEDDLLEFDQDATITADYEAID